MTSFQNLLSEFTLSFAFPECFATVLLECNTKFTKDGEPMSWYRSFQDLKVVFEKFRNLCRFDTRNKTEQKEDVLALCELVCKAVSISQPHKEKAAKIAEFLIQFKVRSVKQLADEFWLRACLEWQGYAWAMDKLHWVDLMDPNDMGSHNYSDDEDDDQRQAEAAAELMVQTAREAHEEALGQLLDFEEPLTPQVVDTPPSSPIKKRKFVPDAPRKAPQGKKKAPPKRKATAVPTVAKKIDLTEDDTDSTQ